MDPNAIEQDALAAVAAASSPAELEDARVHYLGRKSDLKLALRGVRDRESGMTLNAVRERLEQAFAERERELEGADLERRLTEERVDVTLPGDEVARGHLHPITQVRRIVEESFLGLDQLEFPLWHPARSPRATFFLNGDVLRTETSPSQIHELEERRPPLYMVSIGRCYRRDTIDATHYPIFLQFEGLAVDKGLTLADLKGTLLHVMRALYGEERRVRFRTHYFPFTEPSIEPDVSCGICGGSGCRTCKYSGWLEMGGAGMVDPAVLENGGVDPVEWSGFAFGCGLERVAQLRHNLPDIRLLWENDLRVLEQF